MDAQSLFRRAVGFHQEGELAQASRLYAQILAREPANITARQLLTLIHFQEGRHREALAEINLVLAEKPDVAEALATKGNVLIRLGRHADALLSFDRAIVLK